jgi:hypothetical protein
MASSKKTASRSKQDKQFSQILKDFGITGKVPGLTDQELRKVDELFPD